MLKKKYEEEIDEILKKLDGTLPSEPLTQRARRRLQEAGQALGPILSGPLSAIRVGHVMLLSLALIIAAYILPLPSGWGRDLGILGLVLFFLTLVLSILGARRPKYEPRWRGQVIRYDQGHLPAWLRRFLGRH
ncbi:MAG: hypothetical protein Q8R28_14445 [Dehalococcoidia bacterium]|nr:hypothetical protein [Dehalococcoidia bacterium]